MPIVKLQGIGKYYASANQPISILNKVALNLYAGETCAILGESGSGKSTLLNILGLLDTPDCGEYYLGGQDVLAISHDQRAALRNQWLGFVFQSFNLLPRMNALENVALPLVYRGVARREALIRAQQMIDQVGLKHRSGHLPCDLSGGQRQRIAIARALIGMPRVILADEPTGNLDQRAAQDIMALLLSLNRHQGVTLIIVTHDAQLAMQMERQIHVGNGELSERWHCSS